MTAGIRTNEEIKKDVVDQLYWDSRVDASDVRVTVSEGEVNLSGTVPNYSAYEAADEDAWAMSGVRYVRNNLLIKYPEGTKVPTDAQLQANIDNILLWQPDIDATDIEVHVDSGQVILRGSVDAYWKKARAEELALGLIGVRGLTNELAVVPTGDYADKMIAQNIEDALERNTNTDPNLIDVSVENGKVTMSGSVDSLSAFRTAQRIAENTQGVLMIDNELMLR